MSNVGCSQQLDIWGYNYRALFNNFPINDLFETETRRGNLPLIERRLCNMSMSLSTQLDFILVNGNPVPEFLKKPIAGSTIILFFEKLTLYAVMKLSCKSRFVSVTCLVLTVFLLNAHKINDG